MKLLPVTVDNRKLKDEIISILLEEANVVFAKLKKGASPKEESDRAKNQVKEILSKGFETGIEFALWKFAASLDKSRSIPEPGIFLEALRRVARNG